MANERAYIEHIILDWENEKNYRQKILNDPTASAKDKETARERVAYAEKCIAEAKADLAKMDN